MKNESEAGFTDTVIAMAKLFRWHHVAHFRPGMNRRGQWSTAMQGDVGFPDLVLIRSIRGIVVELKKDGKEPTLDQLNWLGAFRLAGFETYVWTPSQWSDIESVLR